MNSCQSGKPTLVKLVYFHYLTNNHLYEIHVVVHSFYWAATRVGDFDTFTYEWVDLGYVIFQSGQMAKIKLRKQLTLPKVHIHPLNFFIKKTILFCNNIVFITMFDTLTIYKRS